MKRIAAIIAATVAMATSAQALTTNISGELVDHSIREPFTYTRSSGLSTAGSYNLALDFTNQGQFLNFGTMSMNYTISGDAVGYKYNTTYTNVTYNLGSASGSVMDSNYNGQNLWLVNYSWGYSVDNAVSWGTNKSQTMAAGKPIDVRNTNGSYLGQRDGNNLAGKNAEMALTGGSYSCDGSGTIGCLLWSDNHMGLEGMSLFAVIDPNNNYALKNSWASFQEVIGLTTSFQISMTGAQNAAPPPPPIDNPASWVGGSGNWQDSANWSDGEKPIANDLVLLEQSDAVNREISYTGGNSPQIQQVKIIQTGTGTMSLKIQDGTLNVDEELIGVGSYGKGSVEQTGGTHNVGTLKVAYSYSPGGNYYLEGGTLNTNETIVGAEAGKGNFIQTGGEHNANTLRIADDPVNGIWGNTSVYELVDGSLNVDGNEHIGNSSRGSFVQDGGTHTVGGNIYIGNSYREGAQWYHRGDASYILNDGSLTVSGDIYMGINGAKGVFTQTGGVHTIYGDLVMGTDSSACNEQACSYYGSYGSSTYRLLDGIFNVENIRAGEGYSTLDLQGGTLNISGEINVRNLILGKNSKLVHTNTITQTASDAETRVDGEIQATELNIENGRVHGNGTITASVAVTGGTIDAGNSIGALTIDGDFNFDGGTLVTEIGGTGAGEFDLITVTGNSSLLSGTLEFAFVDGFTASLGDEWLFLAGNVTGSLENIIFNYNGVPPGLNFIVSKTVTGLKLSAVQAVPVPAAAWLMASGLIGLAGIARRKK
jgi:hypothetical protein